MVWHFIGIYIINRTLHDRLEIRNFSSRVEKYFTRSLRSLVKYFSTLEEKFRISARPCNILYVLYVSTSLLPQSTEQNKGHKGKKEIFLTAFQFIYGRHFENGGKDVCISADSLRAQFCYLDMLQNRGMGETG